MSGRCIFAAALIPAAPGAVEQLAMLGFVAVGAQQLPVAAVGRIVVVIAVPVMDFEQLHVRPREFPRAPAADPRIELERQRPVTLLAHGPRAPAFRDCAVEPAGVRY